MKHILFLFTLLLSQFSLSDAIATSKTIELNRIKAEFFETSQQGIIHVYDCEQCTEKFYKFDAQVKIKRNGSFTTLDIFMNDYWNAKTATLFLNPENNLIKRINYSGS